MSSPTVASRSQINSKILFYLIILLLIFIESSLSSSSIHHNDKKYVTKKSYSNLRPKHITNVKYNEPKSGKSYYTTTSRVTSNHRSKKSKSSSLKPRKPRHYSHTNTTNVVETLLPKNVTIDKLSSSPLSLSSSSYPPPLSPLSKTQVSINDITMNHTKMIECSNDTLMKDFGTSCLKRSLIMAPKSNNNANKLSDTTKPVSSNGNYHNSRYFSVKPMMINRKNSSNNLFKTPAQTARRMYIWDRYSNSKKPMKYPPKVRVTFTPTRMNYYPTPQRKPIYVQSRNPYHHQQKQQQRQYQLDPQFQEDLELLNSLKSSLGILSAQAMNVKQRTKMLYREAKQRNLFFFDGLLMRTHSLISDKQYETKRAMEDIDVAINRMKRQQEITSFMKPPHNLRLSDSIDRYPNGMKKPLPKVSEINHRQINRLMLNGLNHAKHMMGMVRQLNEALDEFEEQFNFPRFEPNSIDEYLKDTEL